MSKKEGTNAYKRPKNGLKKKCSVTGSRLAWGVYPYYNKNSFDVLHDR